MNKRRTLKESLTDKSYVMGIYNKMSDSEKMSWKKAIKECLEENPRLKSNVNFIKVLTGFSLVILIVAIATGAAAAAALPALAAFGISRDKYTFNELRKCVRMKKGLDVEEDEPSTDDEPVEPIKESKRKKIVRMTESDLMKIVKKVIKEDEDTYINKMAKPWRRLAGINLEKPGAVEDYDVSDQELSDISNTLNSLENEINDDPELLGWQRDRLLDNLAFVKDYLEQRKTHGKDF